MEEEEEEEKDDDRSIAPTFARAPLHVERADLRVAEELADAFLIVALLERQVERGRHHVLVRQQHGDGLPQIVGERRELDDRDVLRLRGRFPGAVQGIAHVGLDSVSTTLPLAATACPRRTSVYHRRGVEHTTTDPLRSAMNCQRDRIYAPRPRTGTNLYSRASFGLDESWVMNYID